VRSISIYTALIATSLAFAPSAAIPDARDARVSQPYSELAVGPQYDSTHVYVAAEDLDRFVASFVGTFGGTASQKFVTSVTPMPSQTTFQFVLAPVGTLSVFGFISPIPYPFGAERTGYLVGNFDAAVRAAQADGADIIVAPFPDPIGRDVLIQWPGGVNMQLYWHTTTPSYAKLETIPENRVYLSTVKADEFIKRFAHFSHGKVVSDDRMAPGLEIGRPSDTYRSVRIESLFGKMSVIVSDGHLPYPYGRELTGYEVANLADTIGKAKASGATVLVAPYTSRGRQAAVVQFPGGYIAEIHTSSGN
jgi:predicted enzyme related to lactoylglutathione lyase